MSRLKELRLHGFKSFADQTRFVFEPGVNAVIGPNGSGKSNMADAIRWVHFIDTLYDSAVPLRASGTIALGALFRADDLAGPYRKKLSRCLSRMEEMLVEAT